MSKLFEPVQLGKLTLKNAIVMAPMTRSRAIGNIPNDLMAQYYAARASAGLLITEGTSPSPNGLGYARIPGLFNAQQVEAWKCVTEAVHKKGGLIFVQLMHTGRASHPANLPEGAQVLAPSALKISGHIWTDSAGQQEYPTPVEMSVRQIKTAIQEFIHAGQLAVQAGFDGVELHAANGYLIEQFLNPNVNMRTDEYGGTPEKRMRFVLEIAEGLVAQIGKDRVAVRISPYGVFNDTGPFEGLESFYAELSRKLSEIGLAYIHVVDHSAMGAPPVNPDLKQLIRRNFNGAYILSGGYDRDRAAKDLAENKGDLVAFGRPFISNPDLVEKLKNGRDWTEADQTKFYTPGPEGYIDYKVD